MLDAARAAYAAMLPAADDPSIILRLLFPEGGDTLSRQAEADLASLAETLREAKETPIDILAYWHAEQDRISQAKLRSLKRGMAVRSILRDYGVSSTRIVLRQVALEADSPQLVDIVKIEP